MNDTPPQQGHNRTDGIAKDQLQSFVERIERLEEEKATLTGDIREVYSELKAYGLDPKIVRQLVKDRRMDRADFDEREALLDTYRHALGMLTGTPLGDAAMVEIQ